MSTGRGYRVALVGMAAWFGWSIIVSLNEFFSIAVLRNLFNPETIAIKIAKLVTLGIDPG